MQDASYEQKDPLVIYKLEAYELWKKMLSDMNAKSIATLMRGKLSVPDFAEAKAAADAKAAEAAQQAQARQNEQPRMRREYSAYSSTSAYANYSTTRDSYEQQASAQRQAAANAGHKSDVQQPAKAEPRIGRNNPCTCGPGKKFKNCYGKEG